MANKGFYFIIKKQKALKALKKKVSAAKGLIADIENLEHELLHRRVQTVDDNQITSTS